MKLSELIIGLQEYMNEYGDMSVVMDEGGKGDISKSVGLNGRGNCSFQVVSEEYQPRLENDCGLQGPVLLINIDF
jgi:hypothetical protein